MTTFETIEHLQSLLEDAKLQRSVSSVESAISIYASAMEAIDGYNAVTEAAKELIMSVMVENNQTAFVTTAGLANISERAGTLRITAWK